LVKGDRGLALIFSEWAKELSETLLAELWGEEEISGGNEK